MKLSKEEMTELCYICDVITNLPSEKKTEVCDYILSKQTSKNLQALVADIRDDVPNELVDDVMFWATKMVGRRRSK